MILWKRFYVRIVVSEKVAEIAFTFSIISLAIVANSQRFAFVQNLWYSNVVDGHRLYV